MNISIIVPIYNALDDVKLCLESLKKNFNFKLGEIILINDFSNAETTSFLQDFSSKNTNFQLLENEENLGFVKTSNKAMKEAKGDIIVLLNSDTKVPKNFAEKIIKCFESNEKIGIASPISSHSDYYIPMPKKYNIDKMNLLLNKCHKAEYPLIPSAEGFCFCIRKKVIEQQGYLDEVWEKGYAEEVDYAYRAITNGWKNVLIDDLYIYHKSHSSFGVEQSEKLKAQNKPEFMRRWGGFKKRFILDNNWINPVEYIEECLFPLGNPVRENFKKDSLIETLFSIRDSYNHNFKVLKILGLTFVKKNYKTMQNKIFSVTNQQSKNDKWYKVIYIFGIKLALRNKRKEKLVAEEKERKEIKAALKSLKKQILELKKEINNQKAL